MNPNEFYKDNPSEKWRILCFRFIGRNRRMDRWNNITKTTPVPQTIIDGEKKLIQEAYEQMREACLMDKEYMVTWEDR